LHFTQSITESYMHSQKELMAILKSTIQDQKTKIAKLKHKLAQNNAATD